MNNTEVERLASLAQIHLCDNEADAIRKDMIPFLLMADSLAQADIPSSDLNGAVFGEASIDEAFMTISGLRDDKSVQDIDTDELYKLSPTGGVDGFSIKRLLE